MSGLRVFYTSIFLFVLFIIQEIVVARINFPFNGFSLYLAVLMIVLALEDRTGSLVFGFTGGLIMDLSTSADTPFGQWALVLTIVGYLFSVNRESIGVVSGQGGSTYLLQLLDATGEIKKGDVLVARGSQDGKPFVPGVPDETLEITGPVVSIVKSAADSALPPYETQLL